MDKRAFERARRWLCADHQDQPLLLASRRPVDHPELDRVHDVPIGIHKVAVFRRVILEVGVKRHVGRVQHAKFAWAGANTDPHVAAAVVPRARENALLGAG